MNGTKSTVVLVHGAWHGPWCWQRVVPLLTSRQCDVRIVALPSVGAAPDAELGLEHDAAAVRDVIEEIGGAVLLCGHSYGGMVISQAAYRQPHVSRLVYLCAFVPESGQSLVAMTGGQPAPWIRLLGGGLTLPDLAQADDLFYADCDAKTQAWAVGQLRPQCGRPFAEAVAHPAWKEIRSTYALCTADRVMPPDVQRNVFAPRLNRTVEINAGHAPFLSQPAAVADMLLSEWAD